MSLVWSSIIPANEPEANAFLKFCYLPPTRVQFSQWNSPPNLEGFRHDEALPEAPLVGEDTRVWNFTNGLPLFVKK